MSINWKQSSTLVSHSYVCGYCGASIASSVGFVGDYKDLASHIPSAYSIYICHFCDRPTFFTRNFETQTPGPKFGNDVRGVEDQKVLMLYNEARKCFSQNAFTAVVLSCRKLLMHVAVAKGAQPNLKFIEYVEYLSDKNYIPPDAREWVNHIREKGNEANHEIVIMDEKSATDLLAFSEMLLKLVYEFPANVKNKKKTT